MGPGMNQKTFLITNNEMLFEEADFRSCVKVAG